jgi:acetyl-CoA C-acetyltransferase
MPDAVIVQAVRTAIARSPGALQAVPVEEFGAAAMQGALRRAAVAGGEVGDVIWGNVMAGGGNVGRLTALAAGLPVEVPAMSVDR